jgi:hypothetical protein
MNLLILGLIFIKKFPEESWPKIYLGQDPDPDSVKNRPDPPHCVKEYEKNAV